MKRLKSLDSFRGLAMLYMMVGHMITWWPEDKWILYGYVSLFAALGAVGFIMISGISTMISYRNRLLKVEKVESYGLTQVKHEYLYRAVLIIILGLIYNIFVAIMFMDPLQIWKWFILLTVGACLLMSWPLLKTSKAFRLMIGVLAWIANQVLLVLLTPFAGQFNFYGVLFFILYNSLDQNIILSFFTLFLIGTVIGDIIYDFSQIENDLERRAEVKRKLLYPSLLIGAIFIVIGFGFVSPYFFKEEIMFIKSNFWWLFYSLGIELILISVFISIEEFEIFKTKKRYRFLFYYSYYSLTIFLIQNVNFLFFHESLNSVIVWFYMIITVVLYVLLLRFFHWKWGSSVSLKVQIGKLASNLATRNVARENK